MKAYERDMIRLIRAACPDAIVQRLPQTGKNHLAYRVTGPLGALRFVVPNTPSDFRNSKNTRRELKRAVAPIGLTVQ